MSDPDLSAEFHQFLTYFASNLLILTIAIFWHCFFLIGMGIWSADYLFEQIVTYYNTYYNKSPSQNVPVDYGIEIMLLGMLFGSINYLAGLGISVNHETILKLMSFTP